MDLRDYEQQIREARDHYAASEKPDFALNRQHRSPPIKIGELKTVVLANAAGRRSEDPNSSSVFYLEAREWDQLFFFWTLDLGDQRIIVKAFGAVRMGGSLYRRWLGVDQKFDKKPIAFTVLDRPESPPARDATSDRQLSRRLAAKRLAEQTAPRPDPKKPKKSNPRSTVPPKKGTPVSSSSSEEPLSSDDEPLTSRRRPRKPLGHDLQNDRGTEPSAVSSPRTSLQATRGPGNTVVPPRKKAQTPDLEGLSDHSVIDLGQAAAAPPRPSVIRPPAATRSRAVNSVKAQGPTQNERDELSRREVEVAQELQIFINLKKELNAIRRRKEELSQQE